MLIPQLLSISERSYFNNPLFKTHPFIFPYFLRNDYWSREICNQYYVAVISYWKGECWTGNIGMMLIQCGNEDVSIHQDICTWWQLPIQIQSKGHPFYEILSRGIVMNIISRSSGIKWFFSHIFMDTGNWFLFIFKSNCYSIHKIQPHISYLWPPIFNSMNTRNAIHLPTPFFIQANNTHTPCCSEYYVYVTNEAWLIKTIHWVYHVVVDSISWGSGAARHPFTCLLVVHSLTIIVAPHGHNSATEHHHSHDILMIINDDVWLAQLSQEMVLICWQLLTMSVSQNHVVTVSLHLLHHMSVPLPTPPSPTWS